jgi:hypothetical protein
MGVLAPGSAHARPSAQLPIDVSVNFLAHVSAESPSKCTKNLKNAPRGQGGWRGQIFFYSNFYYLFLGADAKI